MFLVAVGLPRLPEASLVAEFLGPQKINLCFMADLHIYIYVYIHI